MIQDVGSEFGPKKADLDNWRSTPVWQGCVQVPRVDEAHAV